MAGIIVYHPGNASELTRGFRVKKMHECESGTDWVIGLAAIAIRRQSRVRPEKAGFSCCFQVSRRFFGGIHKALSIFPPHASEFTPRLPPVPPVACHCNTQSRLISTAVQQPPQYGGIMLSEVVHQSLFRVHRQKDAMVLELAGDFRRCGYTQKQQEYNRLMRQIEQLSSPRVVFDLSSCEFLDSVTVGVLIGLTKQAVRCGGNTGLAGVSPLVREMLARLLLLEPAHRQLRWVTYADVDEAVRRMCVDVSQN
jgi:anti-anti-sigma factor